MCFQMVMRIGEFVLDLIAVTRMSDDEKEREILRDSCRQTAQHSFSLDCYLNGTGLRYAYRWAA
jgi:hypothetical protein